MKEKVITKSKDPWFSAEHNDLGSFSTHFGCKGGWEKPKEPVDLKLFCVAKLRLKLKMTLAVHLGVKTGLNRDSLDCNNSVYVSDGSC